MTTWAEHFDREMERYRDGEARLPDAADADTRQRQLTRLGNAAGGAGLALLMQGRDDDAADWFGLAAERYRESFADAPPRSWGRLIGAVKSRLLGGDFEGARRDAEWALAQNPGEAESPIGRYAACLALLTLERDRDVRPLVSSIRERDDFPRDVADAVATLAAGDRLGYIEAIERVLRSFETRDEYLEDMPVADTVIVLQAFARRRDLVAKLESSLLPPGSGA
jgi:hypothetical protein